MKRQQSLQHFLQPIEKRQQIACSSASSSNESTDKQTATDGQCQTPPSTTGDLVLRPGLCTLDCCSLTLQSPFQPDDFSVLSTFVQQRKAYKNTFQKKWFKEFPWLSLCATTKKAYCFFCRKSLQKNICLTKRVETAFTNEGFQNWKKGIERFKVHEHCDVHIEAVYKVQKVLEAPSVISLTLSGHAKQQEYHRANFLKELRTLRSILRQGLAIRGHKEDEGNLHQFMAMQAEDCPELKRWVNEGDYMSHDIVNELIFLMGQTALRSILSRIHTAKWFTVMADETRDISNKEQMAVVIRWVDENFDIHEDFIGLVNVSNTSSDTLTEALKDVLIRCILPLSLCRGQAYDGAANMMGRLHGVATQMQAEFPAAIPMHCFAHRLNLCLKDVARDNKVIRDAMDVAMEISRLITRSPTRAVIFATYKEEFTPESTGLRPLCPTRWTVRTGAFEAILGNYKALMETFDEVNSTKGDDYGIRSGGIMALMEKFSTYFGLKLAYLIFGGMEELSKTLQTRDLNIQEALHATDMALAYLGRLRSEEKFNEFYQSVEKEASPHTEEPCLPRYRRPPVEVDNGSEPHRYDTPQAFFRAQYYEVIDLLSGELRKRFDKGNLQLPIEIERLLLESAKGNDCEISSTFAERYGPDINLPRLRKQLGMLPELIEAGKKAEPASFGALKSVTKVVTLSKILTAVGTTMFGEVSKLVKLFLTLPVTTASAERSFSALRRIKTYLRSTMTQKRLNNTLLLHAHHEETDALDLRMIAKEFATLNENRRNYFGNF